MFGCAGGVALCKKHIYFQHALTVKSGIIMAPWSRHAKTHLCQCNFIQKAVSKKLNENQTLILCLGVGRFTYLPIRFESRSQCYDSICIAIIDYTAIWDSISGLLPHMVPQGSIPVSFTFYFIVGKDFAENSRSTSLQRVAMRRVVGLSSCCFLLNLSPQ